MDINRFHIKAPCEVMHLKLGIPQNYKQQLIDELYRIGDKMNHSTNVKASMTSYRLWNDSSKFNSLFDRILKIINTNTTIDTRYENIISSAWGAIYKEGHRTVAHNHVPAMYSWVYYLKTDEYSSPLVFDMDKLVLKVEEDMLVVFPGYLKHMVPEQVGGDDRVVVAGNTQWKLKEEFEGKEGKLYQFLKEHKKYYS